MATKSKFESAIQPTNTDTRNAGNVNEQINPNLTKRERWDTTSNAVGNTKLYTTSHYTKTTTTSKDKKTGKKKTKTVYNYPYKLTAHDFGFNIPLNAYIKSITFHVRMKSSKNKTGSTFPDVGFYIHDKKASVSDDKKGKSGWHNGVYWEYSDKKLSTTEKTETYTMYRSDFLKGKYSISDLNASYFGIDLNFADDEIPAQKIYLKRVWCTIEYDLPKFTLTENHNTTSAKPHVIKSGINFQNYVTFNLNQSKSANAGLKKFKINTPFGCVLHKVTCTKSSYDENNHEWSVNCNGETSASLTLYYYDYTIDSDTISVTDISTVPNGWSVPKVNRTFYYRTDRGSADGYDETTITPVGVPYKRHDYSCFTINSHAKSSDDKLSYQLWDSQDWMLFSFELDNEYTTDGVVINEIKALNNTVKNNDGSYTIPANSRIQIDLTVPKNTEFDWGATFCTRLLKSGNQTIHGVSTDSNLTANCTFDAHEPYEYHLGNKSNDTEYVQNEKLITERINFINHRIASQLETGAYVLPCSVKDGDSVMIETLPSINMYLWEQIDYIGCVPLEHLHFDPKSTYKDKLLDNHYKNNHYMGKELASDETIDLNVRLHPHQVTTMQGLVDIDKPIPINANHRCFEGDALNHRGWAEIYGITTERTNPHWYKCKIDVKYLTHNLNTRFKINRGDRTFNEWNISSILSEINSSGDSIGESENDFFTVDTDGTYAYIEEDIQYEDYLDENGATIVWEGKDTTLNVTFTDEDTGDEYVQKYTGQDILDYIEESGYTYLTPVTGENIQIVEDYTPNNDLRNKFTLDEGQHILIRSRDKLSRSNKISVKWMSSVLNEWNENNIQRIFRIVDKNGNSIFEYEYFDFDFSNFNAVDTDIDDYIISKLACQVIARKKNNEDYDEVLNNQIDLRCDVESGADNDAEDDDEGEDLALEFYGSTLHFTLNDNILSIVDEGYNGHEITMNNIVLEDAEEYYFECYWINKNTDGEDNDIISYFDVTVQDNILDSRYSKLYKHLYVSPFPVTGKKTVFTREAEEGTIYYLEDDSEEFSYLIEPFYQYQNGVDIRDNDGGSILNLNYGYKIIYLENGLVSLGINRLNGQMYLRKWNSALKEYVTTHRLHLTKFDDININSISDDRIELQSSDTIIIMYRGHPYVIFKHPSEDIGLDTTFNKVWGQKVDVYENDTPQMFELMNKDNLLPMCVTGKLDKDCITLSESTVTGLNNTDINVSCNDEVYENQEVNFTVTGQPNDSKVHYLVDGDEVGYTTDGAFTYTFEDKEPHTVCCVYVGDESTSYSISNELIIVAKEVKDNNSTGNDSSSGGSSSGGLPSGSWNLTMSCPSKFTYRDNQKVIFTLTKGGKPVKGIDIQMVDFKVINTGTTNAKGQCSFTNHRVSTYAGKYKIGARLYLDGKLVKKTTFKDVKVSKATPQLVLKSEAGKKNGSFSVKLKQVVNKDLSYNIQGAKLTIHVNNDKKEKKTNEYGNASIKIKKEGKYKYKVTYNGNKGYKSCKFTYRETVKKK